MRFKPVSSALLFAALLLFLPQVVAEDFSGKVVSVLDGDTMDVTHDKKPERTRLLSAQLSREEVLDIVRSAELTLQNLSLSIWRRCLRSHRTGVRRKGIPRSDQNV